ncbi:MAG: type II secretion system F family protein [Candidatus Omnitrophica bacterium]|nr:type II secretion system F family protein [Candidatus Omnitrophota bacterium]
MSFELSRKLVMSLKSFGRVKTSDLVTFTREFATLNNAGLSLIKSLTSLRDQMPDGKFRNILSQVIEGIERGDSFSESLSHFPKVFSRLYVNMIRSGEVSGSLDEIEKRLATLLEKQQRLKKRLHAALIYPAFVLGMALLILSLLMIFVIPTFTKMFADMDSELPGATRFLIAISNVFIHYWYALIAGVVIGIVGVRFLLKFPRIRFYVDKVILRIPLLGKLVSRVMISRFTRTLGTLLNSGVPILSALAIVKETTTNLVYAQCVPRISESVKEGESLARMMEETKIFPMLVIKMVGVGEETGQLSDMLVKVADTYEEDVDVLVASLSSLMEPFLIVIMGLIVGFIVISMFLPLFNIAELL